MIGLVIIGTVATKEEREKVTYKAMAILGMRVSIETLLSFPGSHNNIKYFVM